jgi:hypothetical protein
MCTLSIVPTESGYLAAMNRDELRSRPLALLGLHQTLNPVSYISPREAAGGTWIACNDRGRLLALLNWNLSEGQSRSVTRVSRGAIIPQVLAATDLAESLRLLGELPLDLFAPFRLVGVFREDRLISETRWNGRTMTQESFPWERRHWFSSSLSDEGAQRGRGLACEEAAKQWPTSQSWLRRLHRSHTPHAGPFSICVHRLDAVTVSYTEVCVSADILTMSYLAGSACQKEEFDAELTLAMRGSAVPATT